MEKVKSFLKKNNYVVSFLVGSLCMYMILSYSGVLKSGKYCILEGDLLEIYVPVIRNFCRNILSGQSIYYSWNNSMGMNTSVMLSFYGAFNPLNILYLIFYKADPNVVTAAIVVIKAGLAAMTFQLYEKTVLKNDGFISVVFAILYALCSFQVAYGIVNIIWTDALYILPLVFISIYFLQNKGNPVPLAISYAYIFIVQPYSGFVVGIFSFIYFIISIFLTDKKSPLYKYIFGFIVSVITSVLLSSIAWAPALYQLLNSGISSSEGFASLGINPLDVYNQLFFGNNNSIVENMPNIYCGVLSLLLLPLFFADKNNSVKAKIKAGILLFVLLLSCTFLPLYKLWCALDAPDGWPFRFSFCISFIVVTLAAIEFNNLKNLNIKILYFVGGADLIIYFIEIFLLKRDNILYPINNYLYFLINFAIILVWIGVIYIYKKNIEDEKKKKGVCLLIVLLTCFECVGNGFSSYYKGDNYYTIPETTETQFYSWYENQKQLINYLKSDNSFYRVNLKGDYLYNSDSFSGYNGLSDFSTSENIKTREALRNMGFATSKKVVRNFGITPITKMLLGVKYDVDCYPSYLGQENVNPIEISENLHSLSLGYMVDEKIEDFSFDSSNAFENINSLVSCMINKDIKIFDEIEKTQIILDEEGISLEQNDQGIVFYNYGNDVNSYISFIADQNLIDEEIYIYYDNNESMIYNRSMIVMDGFENRNETGGLLSRSYIKPFELYNDLNGETKQVTVAANGLLGQQIKDYYVSVLNNDALIEAYDSLSSEQLSLDKISNTNIEGKIIVNNDNEILFTTIPYDNGWRVNIDGNNTEIIPILDEAFVGVKIPKGVHEVEFSYKVLGLKQGVCGSIFGIIILGVLFVFSTKNIKKKSTAKEI